VFDFRYHALSLAAVLIALVVGLLLGVAIGDSGLVSSAEKNLRQNLKGDVARANRRADDLRSQLSDSRDEASRFEGAVYPLLVGGQLSGTKIGLVFLGGPSEEIAGDVRSALADTGGSLSFVGVVREPLALDAIAGRATGTRYAQLGSDAKLVDPFGERTGAQLLGGGKLIGAVRRSLMPVFNGKLTAVDAVVLVRRSPDAKGDDATARDAFERGFARGLARASAPAVGIETTTTDPSQVPWYRDHDLTSVDDVDRVAGRAALVFTLQGGAQGAFGTKDTADALLPDVTGGTPSR
jgi:hypothetical protein